MCVHVYVSVCVFVYFWICFVLWSFFCVSWPTVRIHVPYPCSARCCIKVHVFGAHLPPASACMSVHRVSTEVGRIPPLAVRKHKTYKTKLPNDSKMSSLENYTKLAICKLIRLCRMLMCAELLGAAWLVVSTSWCSHVVTP
jgi:hypothetical protein